MYGADYDDTLPPSKGWTDRISSYMGDREMTEYTQSPAQENVVVGMNRNMGGFAYENAYDVENTVMLAERAGNGINQTVDESTPKLEGGRHFAFLDGHAKYRSADMEDELFWSNTQAESASHQSSDDSADSTTDEE